MADLGHTRTGVLANRITGTLAKIDTLYLGKFGAVWNDVGEGWEGPAV